MQKSERDALRKQVLSEDWKCSADLLLSLLDSLDEMEQQIARQNDVIRQLARDGER
jgi:hypothetical protein